MDDPIAGVPIVALVLGLVEVTKRAGLPTRFAGLAAVASATALVALADLAGSGDAAGQPLVVPLGTSAGWLLGSGGYGLAAAGLDGEARRLPLPAVSDEGSGGSGDPDRRRSVGGRGTGGPARRRTGSAGHRKRPRSRWGSGAGSVRRGDREGARRCGGRGWRPGPRGRRGRTG